MDWAKAIEINHVALTRIVAALLALLQLQGGGMATRVPHPVYALVVRVLHKAESAVRRLIVVAARDLVVQPSPSRPMPQGIVRSRGDKRSDSRRKSFQLFDTRKRFSDENEEDASDIRGPRIRVVGDPDPRSPLFLATLASQRSIGLDGKVDACKLGLRLMAVKVALDSLPRQAKRLVRWRAKRALMKEPSFTEPMRPGPPPGHRKKPKDEIDFVLKECHALAWDTLRKDTS